MAAEKIIEFPRRGSRLNLAGLARLSPIRPRETKEVERKQSLLTTLKTGFQEEVDRLVAHGKDFNLDEQLPDLPYGEEAWPCYKDIPLPASIHVENEGEVDAGFAIKSGSYEFQVALVSGFVQVKENHPKSSEKEEIGPRDALSRNIAALYFANGIVKDILDEAEGGVPPLPPAA